MCKQTDNDMRICERKRINVCCTVGLSFSTDFILKYDISILLMLALILEWFNLFKNTFHRLSIYLLILSCCTIVFILYCIVVPHILSVCIFIYFFYLDCLKATEMEKKKQEWLVRVSGVSNFFLFLLCLRIFSLGLFSWKDFLVTLIVFAGIRPFKEFSVVSCYSNSGEESFF